MNNNNMQTTEEDDIIFSTIVIQQFIVIIRRLCSLSLVLEIEVGVVGKTSKCKYGKIICQLLTSVVYMGYTITHANELRIYKSLCDYRYWILTFLTLIFFKNRHGVKKAYMLIDNKKVKMIVV